MPGPDSSTIKATLRPLLCCLLPDACVWLPLVPIPTHTPGQQAHAPRGLLMQTKQRLRPLTLLTQHHPGEEELLRQAHTQHFPCSAKTPHSPPSPPSLPHASTRFFLRCVSVILSPRLRATPWVLDLIRMWPRMDPSARFSTDTFTSASSPVNREECGVGVENGVGASMHVRACGVCVCPKVRGLHA